MIRDTVVACHPFQLERDHILCVLEMTSWRIRGRNGAAEMGSAFPAARKNRLDLSVGIALGSASQIALFVAPILALLS